MCHVDFKISLSGTHSKLNKEKFQTQKTHITTKQVLLQSVKACANSLYKSFQGFRKSKLLLRGFFQSTFRAFKGIFSEHASFQWYYLTCSFCTCIFAIIVHSTKMWDSVCWLYGKVIPDWLTMLPSYRNQTALARIKGNIDIFLYKYTEYHKYKGKGV